MSSNVLFVFEGAGAEPNIARNLRRELLDRDNKIVVQTTYGMNIYKLYMEVMKDEYFDTYEFIHEQLANRTDLSNDDLAVMELEDPEKISEIYLFFDYDCHCSNADDDKIRQMVELFNDSQDKGLLCVSYPMVEAIRHQKGDEIEYLTHNTTDLKNYKKWVNASQEMDKRFLNWGIYNQDIWSSIVKQHLSRANCLITEVLDLPTSPICMSELFERQMEKHRPYNEVAVISGFPLMLLEHYGSDIYKILGLVK